MIHRFVVSLRAAGMVAALLALLTALPAQADQRPHQYLALGDSVAFGFNPLLDRTDANNFVGYPEIVANLLRPHRQLANASCPGEASGGFISFDGLDNVCRPYRAFFPLHVTYSTPQLEYAVDYLRHNPRTDLVTIDIGANDLFVLQRDCGGNLGCVQDGLPALLADLKANLTVIYSAIHQTRYRGNLVAVTYYLTDYNDSVGVRVIGAINTAVAQVTRRFGGDVADGFGRFRRAAAPFGGDSCAAGLLIVLPTGGCDIHPSPAGRDLLAAAVYSIVGGEGNQD